jgi:hypothetical protein
MPEPTNAVALRQTIADPSQRDFVHKMLSELLITLEDQYWKDKRLYIDGYRFINCYFENCTLWVLRGTFEFHHCTIDGGSRIFDQEALKCIQMFSQPDPNPAFMPKRYPDGALSIAKGVSFK